MSDTTANVIVNVVDRASGILGGIGKAFLGITTMAATAALGAGVAAVKLATDFEATMNDFKMAAGDNLNQAGLSADDFTKKFLQLGKDTKYSSKEAAEAGVELVKAGMDIKSVMGDATEATLNLAAAAKSELAPTARIVAQQVQTWADQGANATETANLMAQALNASTITTLDDLALGLANVNGVAKASGASQKDVIVAMAATSKNFASASDQGTSFKAMLQALAGPSKDAKGAMRELGLMTFDYAKAQEYLGKQGIKTDGSARQINDALDKLTKKFKMSKSDAQAFFASFEQNQFYDAEGKFKGMENAAEILRKALSGLSDEAKAQALKDIFGSDGVRFASALAEQGAAGFNGMADSMKKAGTAAEQAAKLNQGLGFVMESIKGSIESVGIAFGLKLLPYITDFAQKYILPMVNGFGDWIDKIDLTKFSLSGLYVALSNAFGGTVADIIMDIITAVQTLFTTIASGGSLSDFSTTMGELAASDVGLFFADLAAAAQNVYTTIVQNWPQISATIGSVFSTIASVVGPIIGGLVQVIADFIPKVFPLVLQIVNFIIEKFMQVLLWVGQNWPLIQSTVATVLNAILVVAQTVWPAIQLAFDVALTFILGIVKSVMQIINGDWSGAMNTLHETNDKMWNLIKDVVNKALEAIKGFVSEKTEAARLKFVEVVTNLHKSAEEWLGKVRDTFQEKLNAVKTFMEGLPTEFYTLGKNIVTGLLNSIIDFGDTVKNKIIEMVTGPLGYIKTLLGIHSPSTEWYWIGQMIGAGLVGGIEDSTGAVVDAMRSMHSSMSKVFTESPLVNEAQGIGQAVGALFGGDESGLSGAVNGGLAALLGTTTPQPAPVPATHLDEAPTIHIGSINVNNQADADYLVMQLRNRLVRR